MRAEVELDNPRNGNQKHVLRPGDYGSATITLSDLRDALAVPSTAIVATPTDSYVLQVSAGRKHRRRVQVLAQQDGWTAIAGTLTEGDSVVVTGGDRVKED